MNIDQVNLDALGRRKWAEENRSSKLYKAVNLLVVFSAFYAISFLFIFFLVISFGSPMWLILSMIVYLPVSIGLVVFGLIANRSSRSNFIRFARMNGWQYKFSDHFNTSEELSQLRGAHGDDVRYVSILGNLVEIGDFEYLVGSARLKSPNRIIQQEPELLFSTERKVPTSVMVSRHQTGAAKIADAFTHKFQNPRKISLEGDFDRFFTLYIENGDQHIETLATIAPDVMQIAKEYSWRFNVRFIGQKVFLQMATNSISKESTAELFHAAASLRRILERQGF